VELIGGHSDAALRRAARLGAGWLHGGGDPAELPGLLELKKLYQFASTVIARQD
jgi:alkanesulfonate monooxygenase SsuD/methylene tetrahydromethanopterin reductase-like flavin-dependent oxidoreductase (luciferase family)